MTSILHELALLEQENPRVASARGYESNTTKLYNLSQSTKPSESEIIITQQNIERITNRTFPQQGAFEQVPLEQCTDETLRKIIGWHEQYKLEKPLKIFRYDEGMNTWGGGYEDCYYFVGVDGVFLILFNTYGSF